MNPLPQSDTSPLPDIDERSAPHWEGLARGALVLRRCGVCRALNHPVADACRVCDSPRLIWVDVEPKVQLFSWAVELRAVIQGMVPPYVIAQVTPTGCEDGEVRLIGTLLADPDDLEIGMTLVLSPVTPPAADTAIATFVPA